MALVVAKKGILVNLLQKKCISALKSKMLPTIFQAIIPLLDFLILNGMLQKSTQNAFCEVHVLLEGKSQPFI